MRYYIYISKSKIDMLFPQVSKQLKTKFSGEVGLDIGILKAKASSEFSHEIDGSDVKRLEIVTDFLEANEKLNSLTDVPDVWVKDTLEVKHVCVKENPDLFLLVGKKAESYHLLAGSAHHIVGNRRPADVNINYSYFPYLAQAMNELALDKLDKIKRAKVDPQIVDTTLVVGVDEWEWSNVVVDLYERSKAEIFNVEFLGRHHARSASLDDVTCTVCSPVYVQQLST